MEYSWDLEIGPTKINMSTGRYAKQTNGSVMVRAGDTVVLVTAVMSDPRPGINFLPLMVNFEERVYGIGRIPGSWNRREGRPRDLATLFARLIDRPLRPLFPENFHHDVQIIATVLSVDTDHEPELLALLGASAALIISDIPFTVPVGAVKVGLIDNEFVVNPNQEQLEVSTLELTVAGTKDAVTMVEASAHELSEDTIIEAIEFGHSFIKKQVALQEKMAQDMAREKIEFIAEALPEEIVEGVDQYKERIKKSLQVNEKLEREAGIDALREEILESLLERLANPDVDEQAELEKKIKQSFEGLLEKTVRQMIIEENYRPDGRKVDEIRDIWCDAGLLPRVHGSAVFTRGQTQAMTALTLGAVGDEQIMFDLGEYETKRFMHHYNFPPFSVGETGPLRAPGRREIGHGALGEKAILPILPSHEDFPYTIRLVSEILESNGSSSQASICASSLALMDGGVPVKAHVAGIAMGLMMDGDKYVILSDIQGLEDFYGDMDFKVAGTEEGITALQMDIKITGINKEILMEALSQARLGRLHILAEMKKTILEPRAELSPYAPVMFTMQIDPEQIRDIIGPQGKTIRKLTEETNTKIDIDDDGKLFILAYSPAEAEKARAMIEELTRQVEVGESYLGKVKRIMNFGVFVEVLPGQEGLVHISRLADYHVRKVEDVVSIGDTIWVKVVEIDDKDRINLSREAVLKEKGEEALKDENRNPQAISESNNNNKKRDFRPRNN